MGEKLIGIRFNKTSVIREYFAIVDFNVESVVVVVYTFTSNAIPLRCLLSTAAFHLDFFVCVCF